jgi:hypothetical protein
MTNMKNLPMRILFAAGIGSLALLWSGDFRSSGPSLVSTADARVGRPLTPVSYAGVARRTTRRAVTYGAAAGAAAAGAAAASSCHQVVDSYGQLTTVCP